MLNHAKPLCRPSCAFRNLGWHRNDPRRHAGTISTAGISGRPLPNAHIKELIQKCILQTRGRDDRMTQETIVAEQQCRHTWHTCGWQMQQGDHNCSHLLDDINPDPPFWKAVDQITADHQLITYRCDNCGTMGSHLVDQDQHIVASTMPVRHVHQQTLPLSQPAKEPKPPKFTFPTTIEPPLNPSLPGL